MIRESRKAVVKKCYLVRNVKCIYLNVERTFLLKTHPQFPDPLSATSSPKMRDYGTSIMRMFGMGMTKNNRWDYGIEEKFWSG